MWAERDLAMIQRSVVALLTLLSWTTPAPATTDLPAPGSTPRVPLELDSDLFPVPDSLRTNVAFWTDVFTRYDSQRVVLHDEEYLKIVYAILDFSEVEASDLSAVLKQTRRHEVVQRTQKRYRSLLLALGAGRKVDDDAARKRIEKLLREVPGGAEKYTKAADRLRTQTGLRDRFETAIVRSGRYMSAMEETFRRRGVPIALTRMAFVESMFQEGARSKVGAGGIWQIMPATGRQFLNIGLEADERFDPLRAADAAAQILRQNYETLKSWPLAITAYNYGVNGMRRAVNKLGTRDAGVVFAQHKSRTFGFASRNFYSEFLAAAQTYADRERLFPDVSVEPPLLYDSFTPGLYVSLKHLATEAKIPFKSLEELNPALNEEIWQGDLFVPKGYVLRVPAGTGSRVAQAFDALPANTKSSHQTGTRHRVRRGETVSGIARRYGSSVAAIQRANKLRRASQIRIGQVLFIPPRGNYRARPAAAQKRTQVAAAGGVHVVRKGETLSSIARRYGTSVTALQASNSLGSSHRIVTGRRLKIPTTTGASSSYKVRAGDTLAQIAKLYGTTVNALRSANDLAGHLIYPSQVLIIP